MFIFFISSPNFGCFFKNFNIFFRNVIFQISFLPSFLNSNFLFLNFRVYLFFFFFFTKRKTFFLISIFPHFQGERVLPSERFFPRFLSSLFNKNLNVILDKKVLYSPPDPTLKYSEVWIRPPVSARCTDPSSRTLAVSDPQVLDLRLVSVRHGASEDQRVVGQSESVAAAGVSDGRKTSGCRRKDDRNTFILTY